MRLARETKAAHHDPPLHEPASVLTVVLLLHQALKARKASKAQQVHKVPPELRALLEPPVQQAQQALLARKAQQVLMVQTALTVLMEQQAHKDRKALLVLRVHKVIQD